MKEAADACWMLEEKQVQVGPRLARQDRGAVRFDPFAPDNTSLQCTEDDCWLGYGAGQE